MTIQMIRDVQMPYLTLMRCCVIFVFANSRLPRKAFPVNIAPYAPEYNPDEFLDSDVKRGLGKRSMPHSKEELEHHMRSHMKSLQLNHEKVASFFYAPTTSCAA